MGLPEIPTDESIILHLNSIGLTDEIEIRKFIGLLTTLRKRKEAIDKVQNLEELIPFPEHTLTDSLSEIASTYEQQSSSLMSLVEQDNRKKFPKK
ncbi:hypothetical protein [Paenibacillus validus]|uniref:hypothetical protein n=1 Tax=Paenibacillus validus TaxID=44253 RepID=UPI003D2A5E96